MKKIVLLLLVVCICAISFTACSPDLGPYNKFCARESYTYTVYSTASGTRTAIGTMDISLLALYKEDVACGSYSLTDFSGYKLNYTAAMDNGDTLSGESYFYDTSFKPALSQKAYNTAENKSTVTAKYDGETYSYRIDDGDEQQLKVGGTYCDNEYLYFIIRNYDLSNSRYSVTFSVPSALNGEVQSVITSRRGNGIITVGGVGYDANEIGISLNMRISGKSYTAYYNANEMKHNGYSLNNVPLLIVEDTIEYELLRINSVADYR